MKFLAVCACLSLVSVVLIPRATVYSQQREGARQRYADDRIVIKYKGEQAGDTDSLAEEIVRAPGVRTELLSERRAGAKLIHLDNNLSVEEAVSRASADPRVEYAEPDYFVYATDTVPEDPFFKSGQMWGLASCPSCGEQSPNIDATRAWDFTHGSDDIIAVVLDTGVDLSHEDLAANAWVNPGEIAGNKIDDDGNGFADDVNGWNFHDSTNQTFVSSSEDYHGTHVAGSIGAVGDNRIGVTGVAWHVKLMSLKFLGGPTGKGTTSNAVKGIYYALDMRNRGFNVRVINASWGGGGDSQALREAISAANNAGILFVCAAGNESNNVDDTPSFPSAYAGSLAGTISVAALDQNGNLASFSNYGHDSVSLGAPGVHIVSTYPGNSYASLSGTSMASPYVTGIAVLVWAQEPSLSSAQVKKRIVDTSQPLNSLASIVARSGRASAYAALTNPSLPAQSPVIAGQPRFTKHSVTIDGFGFVDGSSVIEVDGTPLGVMTYDNSFALANGSLTRLVADPGKKPLKRAFPSGVSVTIDVVNTTTGQRSPQITTARF